VNVPDPEAAYPVNERIEQPKVILTEGRDAQYFCQEAIRAYGISGYQAIDFKGNSELPLKLKTLRVLPGFEQVQVLVVARDMETSVESAVASIRDALTKAGFAVPDGPFETKDGTPKVAFVLFPGFDDSGNLSRAGTLEHLCLSTVSNAGLMNCVEAFLSCCEHAGSDMRYRHKMQLHAYLAGTGDKGLVGMRIGQAARAGAWNWQHPRMKPFKDLLVSL
jgi:hypothetical protein